MCYRKFYTEQTGVKLPKGFVVHHIDLNRGNNQIDNLVAVPSKLHSKFHVSIIDNIDITSKVCSVVEGGNRYNSYCMQMLNHFIRNYTEMCMWVDYKYYLLGLLPNIHNLKYEVN